MTLSARRTIAALSCFVRSPKAMKGLVLLLSERGHIGLRLVVQVSR
jgi:hypothetical protein